MKNTIAILVLASIVGVVLSYQSKPKLESNESPIGMTQHRAQMRGGEFRSDKLIKAYGEKKAALAKLSKNRNKDGGLNQWEELGPKDYSGRILAIANHPTQANVMFLGADTGGLWKTTNNGNTWAPVDDFLPSLSVTKILIHPTNPDTMYVSTGNGITIFAASGGAPGAGILRSYDGGDTWEVLPEILNSFADSFYYTNEIIFDPVDPSTIYAGTSAYSKNGSSTIFGCSRVPGVLYKISNHGNDVERLAVSCDGGILDMTFIGGGGTILCGQTAGMGEYDLITQTFTSLNGVAGFPTSPGRVEVQASPSNSSTLYALCEGDTINFGKLYKSTNNGLSWTDMFLSVEPFRTPNGRNQGWFDNALWVDPLDEDNLLIGGIDLYRSTTGGGSFTRISNLGFYRSGTSLHGDQHVILEDLTYSDTTRRVWIGNDGGIARTADYRTASLVTGWQLMNNNSLGTSQGYWGYVTGDHILQGAQDNGTSYSDDGGLTWSRPGPNDGGYCAISEQDDRMKYYTSQRGVVYTENSTGLVFTLVNLINEEPKPQFICPLTINPKDGHIFLIGSLGLYRVRRNDIINPAPVANSVENIGPDTVSGRYITAIEYSTDTTVIYVGYNNGDLYKGTRSGGAWSWLEMDYDAFNTRPITSVAVRPGNKNKVAISIGGYFPNRVFLTTNGGTDWVNRSSGLPDIHVNDLTWHPDIGNWLYCATEMGIYASEDNGINWNITPNFVDANDGPAFVEVSNIMFGSGDDADRHKLYAFTFGRGVWVTETTVAKSVYVDEDSPSPNDWGTSADPFKTIKQAEDYQAHGQNWTIDEGVYTVPSGQKVVLKKRIGKIKKTGAGSIIIKGN